MRASTGVGTSSAEVDRLLAAVAQFVTTGPGLEYGLVDGHWGPLTDARPAPEEFLPSLDSVPERD